jgi:tRNA(Ile)-lysidine synthase
MEDLSHRFKKHWKARGFPSDGKTILLALSGGIDSMALAQLLLSASIPFVAAHVNFNLRAKDADDDALFVQGWCAANNIRCHYADFATTAIAAERQQSIQVTARELRYEWFEQLRKEHQYAAILTAHHAGDVAETMIINLCRGSGISGLHGIPERNGAVIRPLLFVTRPEIEEYVAGNEISWREDASNASDKYLRNSIRLHVLPKLEELMPGAGRRIAETAQRLLGTEVIYRKEVDRRLAKLIEQRGKDWYVPIRLLLKQAELSTLAYELFTPFGFSPEQVPHILELLDSDSGRQVIGPSHRVIKNRDFLVITSIESEAANLVVVDTLPSQHHTAEGSFQFSLVAHSQVKLSEDSNTAMLDADELKLPLLLRTRREGDYFYPLGMGMKKKKLKRFLIDTKTPLHEKDSIRILESDKRILWIAGKRIDERFKVKPTTRQILKVVFTPAN